MESGSAHITLCLIFLAQSDSNPIMHEVFTSVEDASQAAGPPPRRCCHPCEEGSWWPAWDLHRDGLDFRTEECSVSLHRFWLQGTQPRTKGDEISKLSRKRVQIGKTLKRCYLRVFLVSAIHDGGAANLGQFRAMTKEWPAANFLIANNVLEEENSPTESQWELLK